MNTDTLNEINTSQQYTKKGSYEELEGYLRFKKAINSCEQVLTPNQNP